MTVLDTVRGRFGTARRDLEARVLRLERRPGVHPVVEVTRRFMAMDGGTFAGLIAIELFTTVLPLVILGFALFNDAKHLSIGFLFSRQLGLHGNLEDTMRSAFGNAAGLRAHSTIFGIIGFLAWGVPMSLTVARMFAAAWRRQPFPPWQRLYRGAAWFVLYLVTLLVRDAISFPGAHNASTSFVLFLVGLLPMWALWTVTPAVIVRGGHRGVRQLLAVGLIGMFVDGFVLSVAARIAFPIILSGWSGFGAIGVAMSMMTWCGVLGVGWVVTACASAWAWERLAPDDLVAEVERAHRSVLL